MKTVLLTGATGFIGRYLLRELCNQYPEQYRIVALSSKVIPGVATILHKNYTFKQSDFHEQNVETIDILIHAGAFIPKSGKEANNIRLCNSNITNTEYLLNNLPSIPQKIIYLSTIDVYGYDECITEDTVVSPNSLYGWSKLYCEKAIQIWGNENQTSTYVLRIGHVYGSGEELYQKVIPNTIRACVNGKSPVIFTDGKEKRAFLHVLDCVAAIIKSIEIESDVATVNITSEESLSILEISTQIRNIIDPTVPIVVKNEVRDARSLSFDSSKMKKLLHVPTIAFKDGIREEIENFKVNGD